MWPQNCNIMKIKCPLDKKGPFVVGLCLIKPQMLRRMNSLMLHDGWYIVELYDLWIFFQPILLLTTRGRCLPHGIDSWFSWVVQFHTAQAAGCLPHADLPPSPISFYSKKKKKEKGKTKTIIKNTIAPIIFYSTPVGVIFFFYTFPPLI